MDDTERIARLRSRLVKKFGRWLGDKALAEDVFHDACLKVLEGAGASRPESLLPWLESVVRTVAIDHLRQQASEARRRRRLQELPAESHEDPLPHSSSVVCACVGMLLEELPERYRRVLQLVDIEGRNGVETSRLLRTTPNNVRVRLHRARAALAKAVKRACGPCARDRCRDCTCRFGSRKSVTLAA